MKRNGTSNLLTKYKYYPFNEIKFDGEYNFYGIIYDASFPVFEELPQPHYTCVIRTLDNSFKGDNEEIITIVIKTVNKTEIPYIHRIGDIIRIQRGSYRNGDPRTVFLNFTNQSVTEKSSWCVFNWADDLTYAPYLSSSTDFYFDSTERNVIENLHEWYLNNNNQCTNYENEVKLNERNNASNDADTTVLVVHKEELEDKIVFFVQDATDACELHMFKYFKFVEIRDVLRWKGIKWFNNKIIVFNPNSNALWYPDYTVKYKEFMNTLIEKMNEINKGITIPRYNTEDIPRIQSAEGKKIIAIAPKPNQRRNKENIWLNVNIITINNADKIYILCTQCNSTFLVDDITLTNGTEFNCITCNKVQVGKIHFNMKIICREHELSNTLITWYWCDHDGEGNGFWNVSPREVIKNKHLNALFEKKLKKLKEENLCIQVLVERVQLNTNNEVFRIIGDYAFNL